MQTETKANPTYQRHQRANSIVIAEVMTNPSSYEPLGKCHVSRGGEYRYSCVSLAEADRFVAEREA